MLMVAPRFDEATQFSYKWAVQLAQELEGQQTKLLEREATRENFEREIRNHNLFVFYNHGDEDRLLAQDGRRNILDAANVGLVANKEVYTMACLSAKKLGVEAWKRKAVYWGYTEVFGFTTEEEGLFCEAANYGLTVKVKEGLTWKESLERARERFDELIDKAKDAWTRIWLRHDRDALVCYNGEQPKTECPLRMLTVKIFGRVGWQITRPRAIALLLFGVGFGVAVGGYIEILSRQGGYIGFILILVAVIMEFRDFLKISS